MVRYGVSIHKKNTCFRRFEGSPVPGAALYGIGHGSAAIDSLTNDEVNRAVFLPKPLAIPLYSKRLQVSNR